MQKTFVFSVLCGSAHRGWGDQQRGGRTLKEPVKDLTLSERIEKRAQELHPDKASPVISKIIEAREVIAKLRLSRRSWAYLVGILEAERICLTQGTLRNYMAKIGKAEAALKDEGVSSPTNEHIRAVVWRALPNESAGTPSQPYHQSKGPTGAQSASSVPTTSSLTRNPNREV